jgi:molybdopterin/thiamine biosynthesis adenylyltransferase/rhodanese-related sulfurtransferase
MSVTDRYARQVILPEVGAEGQARLGQARVLIVGAGGLGCAALPYLAGAGVGRLRILDPDRVEAANLHRQVLYRMSDVGRPKASAARDALLALNPQLEIEALTARLDPANAASLAAGADVVIDAADSFAVTYTLSDTCQRAGTPLVSASVVGLSGYVGAFCGGAPSYRAVFPELPRAAASCDAAGVLGTAVAVVGALEAHLTLALLLKWQPPVLGRLISLDFRSLHLGGFAFAGAVETASSLPFIAPAEVRADDLVIDLRGTAEAPSAAFPNALRLSVEALEGAAPELPEAPRVVLCCRSGVRAWRAARALERRGRTQLALLALGA